jgi:thiamine-monophosphate kinase
MSRESALIAALRALAVHPAARGLADDAAMIEIGGARIVLTHDMIVEGVHFLPGDAPADVAWKLVAVNLSDLAGKGARPIGALLGYCLTGEEDWDAGFVAGLGLAIGHFGLALLGGDTVALPPGAPRMLGLTALGEAAGPVPPRAGARPGDRIWVSGTMGDSGVGLRILRGEIPGAAALVARYRRPEPRLAAGEALAPIVGAMMDVSDGLLIDASRMAAASGARLAIDLAAIPLSEAFLDAQGGDRGARLAAATSGDDYELLFAAAPDRAGQIAAIGARLALPLTAIGAVEAGSGLSLSDGGEAVALPPRLGWEHC